MPKGLGAEIWVTIFEKLDAGASVADLSKEYGITRQAIYVKMRNRKDAVAIAEQ